MAQLKSTTINGNLTVTGNINGYNIANINSNANTALSTANTALTRANYGWDYALTTNAPMQSHKNLNYYFAPGIYNVSKADWIDAAPAAIAYGTVIVFSRDIGRANIPNSGSWIYQIYISTNTSKADVFIRKNINYTASGWSSWIRIA